MKAILEFNLPEDRAEFLVATRAGDTACAVQDLYNYVRSHLKHGSRLTDLGVLEAVLKSLYELVEESD